MSATIFSQSLAEAKTSYGRGWGHLSTEMKVGAISQMILYRLYAMDDTIADARVRELMLAAFDDLQEWKEAEIEG